MMCITNYIPATTYFILYLHFSLFVVRVEISFHRPDYLQLWSLCIVFFSSSGLFTAVEFVHRFLFVDSVCAYLMCTARSIRPK